MTTKEILSQYKTIAVYGMSKNSAKPSNAVPHFMLDNGYNIIPVNPGAKEIDGMTCYSNLLDIPENIEILDVFRPDDMTPDVVKEAIERKAHKGDIKVIWLQLGIINDEAKKLAEENGFIFVQDKCLKIEYNREF